MSIPTMSRAHLGEIVRREIGLSRSDAADVVEQVLEHMCEALWKGEDVKITGFGTFKLRDKAERIGRDPKRGRVVPIAARRVVTFQPSQKLRDRTAGA